MQSLLPLFVQILRRWIIRSALTIMIADSHDGTVFAVSPHDENCVKFEQKV